ncbi:strictosidine synthase 2 [Hibiscus trionum]|uniref:Strictosidine synthase 2 n=1 Tax=Hibiscus trionum TaxID=183268 RepID=A0A9W7HH05_HIBTR|nr:strictosidine synthase 2 [Hibiscus trionum]
MRTKTIATLILLFYFLSTVVSAISFSKIQLPRNASGPESLAFEFGTGHFFTGIADGRILKYRGPTTGFVDFGFAAPNRSKSMCDGTHPASTSLVCGRPVGMALHHQTNRLYVCDAFFGFGVLGPEGGLVNILSTAADGKPYRLCDDVSVHQPTGNVYFTDASAVYNIRQFKTSISVKDSTGRLLKYNAETKQVTVLFSNLSCPGGVAVDDREKFVLVSEFIANRTRKIWLNGPKPYKSDIVNTRPRPGNIRKTRSGDFWIAAGMIDRQTQSKLLPTGEKINANGNVIETVNLEKWYGSKLASEVHMFDYKLYIASPLVDFIGVYEH